MAQQPPRRLHPRQAEEEAARQPPIVTYVEVVITFKDGSSVTLENVVHQVNMMVPIGSATLNFQEKLGDKCMHIFPLIPKTEIRSVRMKPSAIELNS